MIRALNNFYGLCLGEETFLRPRSWKQNSTCRSGFLSDDLCRVDFTQCWLWGIESQPQTTLSLLYPLHGCLQPTWARPLLTSGLCGQSVCWEGKLKMIHNSALICLYWRGCTYLESALEAASSGMHLISVPRSSLQICGIEDWQFVVDS